MSGILRTELAGPIASAEMLDGGSASGSGGLSPDAESGAVTDSAPGAKQSVKQGLDRFLQVNEALRAAAAKLNDFRDSAVAAHKEDIARLSVEIARKVLAAKVEDRDYEIEAVVKETLGNAPAHEDVVVHLNPEDLAQYQKAQQDTSDESPSGVKFVPDPKIGRAECLLETPKGVVESFIAARLEQIAGALKKAQ